MIRHNKLFHVLIKRGISAVQMRLLVNLYDKQLIRATCKGCHSQSFTATNGIRQGSIVSLLLFCCYVDELLCQLQAQGVGCWMSQYYCGAISYADDLTLLGPTARGLQKQIQICEEYAKNFGMSYNPVKSFCVLFSRKPTKYLFS